MIIRQGQIYTTADSSESCRVLIMDSKNQPITICGIDEDICIGIPDKFQTLIFDPVYKGMIDYTLLDDKFNGMTVEELISVGAEYFDVTVPAWKKVVSSDISKRAIRVPSNAIRKVSSEAFDVMIDIETMGTCENAVICTIGAVLFDIKTGEPFRKFYHRIEWENDAQPLRIIEPDTAEWWDNQPSAAKTELYCHAKRISLSDSLLMLRSFIPDGAYVWGNGPSFDLTILKNAYRLYTIPVPWSYSREQCCRTIERAGLINKGIVRDQFKRSGEHHNAIDDALYQIEYVSKTLASLGQ